MIKQMSAFALLTVFVVCFTYGCAEKIKPGNKEAARPQISGIKTAKVEKRIIRDIYEISGTLKAANVATLSSKLMGEIKSIAVKDGDTVKAGQTLLTVGAREFADKTEQAEAGTAEAEAGLGMAKENKQLAETTYDRFKKLYEDKAISKQEFDEVETKRKLADIACKQATAAHRRARSALGEAHVFQGYTNITAPFDGVVGKKMVEMGVMVAPGMPLITVEDTSSFNVIIDVDEGLATDLKMGTHVDVSLKSLSVKTKGTVKEVSPQVDPTTRTFTVKIAIAEKSLRSGLYAVVSIDGGQRLTIGIPETAIVEKGQLRGVYTVDDKGVTTYRLITSGRKLAATGTIEVLSGLAEGDEIIVEGTGIDGGQITGHGQG